MMYPFVYKLTQMWKIPFVPHFPRETVGFHCCFSAFMLVFPQGIWYPTVN